MQFKEFWPRYLKAHSQPGTRALHYLASAVGALSALQAFLNQQIWIFVLGLGLSYAIAIASHWFIEHNQPLIRVNAFWGAVANLRMCWLALTNQLHKEYRKYGIPEGKAALSPLRQEGSSLNK